MIVGGIPMLFGGALPITPVAVAQTQNAAIEATLVISKPTGTVQGDLMLAVLASDGNITWTGDTDWIEIADQGVPPGLRIAYKIAGASEGVNYTFTASTGRRLGGSILTYSNAAYDAVGAISLDETNPVTASAVTASVNSSLLLAVYVSRDAGVTCSTPTGFGVVDANSDWNAPSWAIFSKSIDAGSSGTVDSTLSTASNGCSVLLSIKQA